MQIGLVQAEQFVGKMLGDYRIERLIGQGGWNAVYQAKKRAQQQSVLMTVFFLPNTSSAETRRRFIERLYREGTGLVKLQHPHILPLIDIGNQSGYAYLIRPLIAGHSLSSIVKRKGKFTPAQTLELFKPVSAALDYAHTQGVTHGALSLANLLIDAEQTLLVTSFGINRIETQQGLLENTSPGSHLLTIGGTPLSALKYAAPEIVQGSPADTRADIYAAGMLLFELLSGALPSSGADPREAATRHIQQQLPLLYGTHPEIPPALDAVIQQATSNDAARRFQTVGELTRSFEKSLTGGPVALAAPRTTQNLAATRPLQTQQGTSKTESIKSWQLKPPIVTDHLPLIPPAGIAPTLQTQQPMAQPQPDAQAPIGEVQQDLYDSSLDPFTWWANTAAMQTQKVAPGSFAPNGVLKTSATPVRKRRGVQREERRHVVALLVTGGVIATAALAAGGIALEQHLTKPTHPATADAHLALNKQASPTQAQTPTAGATSKATSTQAAPTATPQATQATQPAGAATPAAQTNVPPQQTKAAQQPAPAPTKAAAQPTPTPQPPAQPSGTVIGSTSLTTDTSSMFTNPGDGAESILVHLPSGSFAAYERACTHQGTAVYYDGGLHRLSCPAHGSSFDPAQGGRVITGPANQPLKSVAIHVNADGTITA